MTFITFLCCFLVCLNSYASETQFIFIAGGSASGKTTLSETLVAKLGKDQALLISVDNYLDKRIQPKEDYIGDVPNFDNPSMVNWTALNNDLKELQKGQDIKVPIYDFASWMPVGFNEQPWKKNVIVEGIHASQDALDSFSGLRIFLDVKEELRYQRRIHRDLKERNYPLEIIEKTFYEMSVPYQKIYLDPTKHKANLLVENFDRMEHLPVLADYIITNLEGFRLEGYNSKIRISLNAFNPAIILAGPPGSGKGTFSQYFKNKYGYEHVCVGDILRKEIELQTSLGKEIKEIVQNGEYVNPKIIEALLAKSISELQQSGKPFILDGFGQNEGDAKVLKQLLDRAGLLSKTFLFYLDASDEICLKRINGRSVCTECGYVYNSETAVPATINQCDICGKKLQIKINDQPEVVFKRLQLYRQEIERRYKEAFSIFPTLTFDSSGSMEQCFNFYDELAKSLQDFSSIAPTISHLNNQTDKTMFPTLALEFGVFRNCKL